MRKFLKRAWNEQSGQDLVEVALLLVMLTLAAVASLGKLATGLNGAFTNAAAGITNAGGAGGGGGQANQ